MALAFLAQTGPTGSDASAAKAYKARFSTSVVICAYTERRWHDLVEAIESLRRQTIPPSEVVLVVDHNPALLQRASAKFKDVLVVENDETHGLSGARNSGLAAANGEIIVFLDDDAIAAPDWLENLTRAYDTPDVVGAVMGVGGASVPVWQERQPSWFPEEFNWVVGCSYVGLPVTTAAVRNMIGCNMSFRREVFDAVGGFRKEIGRVETRPSGCEETELCIRATQLWPERIMLYEPNALVFHRVPQTRARWGYFFSRCYSEGLAKASVSKFVGSKDGLAAEWKYSLQTLPMGVMRGVADATVKRDPNGLARAGAIVAGLTVTAAGYIMGRVSSQAGH